MPHHHWDDPEDRISNILLQFRFIPHDEAPESCRWTIDTNRDEIGSNYKQAEQPFREEIENYILSLSTEEPLPKLSPGAEYFLGVRTLNLISADGNIIYGWGLNPDNLVEMYKVVLDLTPTPTPTPRPSPTPRPRPTPAPRP